VVWVSFDGFQSADLLQRVRRLGIKAGRISADSTSPNDPMQAYETLRMAISEGRFQFPADEETVSDMLALQADYSRKRVDHLPGRKNDVSDCLACVAFHLTHRVNTWAMVDKVAGGGGCSGYQYSNVGRGNDTNSARGIRFCDAIDPVSAGHMPENNLLKCRGDNYKNSREGKSWP
jgi:hypothetical protein